MKVLKTLVNNFASKTIFILDKHDQSNTKQYFHAHFGRLKVNP